MLKLALLGVLLNVSAFALKNPVFDGGDAARPRIAISLEPWIMGVAQVTDIQFEPGGKRVFILRKTGELVAVPLDQPTGLSPVLTLAVQTPSELGLLGLAFHPRYATNHKFYLNYNPAAGERRTRISEWVMGPDGRAGQERILLEVPQPFPNHDAGQLVFGPDGFLYIGLGDGGDAGDPHGNGQNPKALLGKMLRIDVDGRDEKKAYAVPKDNPFVIDNKFAPEIWAWGLRNPWRYTFDPRGRLIVADVGQNLWEEVSIVEAGKNYGWRTKEASHCYKPDHGCSSKGLADPWIEYGRSDGGSITGGYVYTGRAVAALQGKYLFGDFVSGRLWAADLPNSGKESATTRAFSSLGRWPISPSTFGQSPDGEVVVGDFTKGIVYRVTKP